MIALLSSSGAIQKAAGQSASDLPSLTISRSGANVFVTWFANDGVAYQVESSTDLTNWTNFSSVISGTGNFLNVPAPVAGQPRRFFRVTLPGVASAVFDPGTGMLSINGDNLDNTIVVSRDATGNLRINNGVRSPSPAERRRSPIRR